MNEFVSQFQGDSLETRSKFRPPAIHQVKVEGFFGPRIDTIADLTVHTLLDRCEEAGMLDQIDPDRPNPGIRIPFQNPTVTTQMFWDSDLGKCLEAAAFSLFRKPDPALEQRIDAIVDAYGRLQDDNGYLNSWYQRIEPDRRWTNLRDCHELYNAGHLMEAAVAYFHATGKRTFLDIMARYADHIATVFGPGQAQKQGYCGHPEIELALIKLGRATGEQRYLDLARFFVDERGKQPSYYDREAEARGENPRDYYFETYHYMQAHEPVRDQREVVGHAVRAAYLYSGMADVATEFGDQSLRPALESLWTHLTEKNLYVTGGFGPSAHNEGLTFDYDLPNETAYAETCAAVSLVFWANRMLGLGPDRRYADVMERALYNGALSGLSLDGTRFFYENPLESRGGHHRWIWHKCPCCPPNIARLLASLGTYMYGEAQDALAIHLYCESQAELAVGDARVRISQQTTYPANGAVSILIDPVTATTFTLYLRLPEWAGIVTAKLNGEALDIVSLSQDGYLAIKHHWTHGDEIELDFEMPVLRLHAHPKVINDQGRVALQRGPLVYCLEAADNGDRLNSLVLDKKSPVHLEEADDLDGVTSLVTDGRREVTESDRLYSSSTPRRDQVPIRAVPYYAWDNRNEGEMLVWIREENSP